MEIRNLDINGIKYNINTNELKNHVVFNITGRKFKELDIDGNPHELTLNQIFDAISKRSDVSPHTAIHAFRDLKDFGFRPGEAEGKGSRITARIFHALGIGGELRKNIDANLKTRLIDFTQYLKRAGVIKEEDCPSFFNHKQIQKKSAEDLETELSKVPIFEELSLYDKELNIETAREIVKNRPQKIEPAKSEKSEVRTEDEYILELVSNHLNPLLKGKLTVEEYKNRPALSENLFDNFIKEYHNSNLKKEDLEERALDSYMYVLAKDSYYKAPTEFLHEKKPGELDETRPGFKNFLRAIKPGIEKDFPDIKKDAEDKSVLYQRGGFVYEKMIQAIGKVIREKEAELEL